MGGAMARASSRGLRSNAGLVGLAPLACSSNESGPGVGAGGAIVFDSSPDTSCSASGRCDAGLPLDASNGAGGDGQRDARLGDAADETSSGGSGGASGTAGGGASGMN